MSERERIAALARCHQRESLADDVKAMIVFFCGVAVILLFLFLD